MDGTNGEPNAWKLRIMEEKKTREKVSLSGVQPLYQLCI